MRHWRIATLLAATLAVFAGFLPGGVASAAPAARSSNFKSTLAKARKLSAEIDNLSEQYDGLKIQLSQARAEVRIARENAARDARQLAVDQSSIGQIAAEGYMTGGIDPAMQLLQTSSPQNLLTRASIMTQLEQQNGARVSVVAAAETGAQRARAAAALEQQRANILAKAMAAKVAAMQQKADFFNSQVYQQATAIFQQTGKYPAIVGDSIGVQALRWALTRRGYPYVWGAAGPTSFDCSGLVVWSYGKLGISLPHFTGDLWQLGVHVSRSELRPGDLVFFYANESHVGIYVGDGLMVDAPTFGQVVQIQPVMWNVYVGAVRIIA